MVGKNQQVGEVGLETWTSRPAFLFATVGAAIGLGNLWRFPYVAGENGGGAFILIYMALVFLLGVPIMVAEMAIGRRGHGSAVKSVYGLVKTEKLANFWKSIGWLSVAIPFIGLSYYSVVACWVMDYVWLALNNSFAGMDNAGSNQQFQGLTESVPRQILLHITFLALVVWVVGRGVKRGIERVSKIMIPGLFLLLTGLLIYNVIVLGVGDTLSFLFRPDFSQVNSQTVLVALGQAFFSVAIGVGVLMTYSAYVPPNVSLTQSAFIICSADLLVALLAGMVIFPVVFHYGLNPGEGPNLIFVTLPIAFGNIPGGYVVGSLFFVLVFFAAFTTGVGMLEPTVAWLRERTGKSRVTVTIAAGMGAWLIGLPSLLSFNTLADFYPLSWIPRFETKTAFDVLDFLIANLLLPLNGLLIALFAGWALTRSSMVEEIGIGNGALFNAWRFVICYIAPVAIVWIILDLWF